jgi:hypothetical protein
LIFLDAPGVSAPFGRHIIFPPPLPVALVFAVVGNERFSVFSRRPLKGRISWIKLYSLASFVGPFVFIVVVGLGASGAAAGAAAADAAAPFAAAAAAIAAEAAARIAHARPV